MWKELPRANQIFDFTKYTDPAYLLVDEEEDEVKDVPDEILEEKPKMTFTI
jgi:hypothetical protein